MKCFSCEPPYKIQVQDLFWAILLLLVLVLSSCTNIEEVWLPIQDMNKSISNSRNVIIACSKFIKDYPKDKHAKEAQEMIDKLTIAIQAIPNEIRNKGIPLKNGFAANLAGAFVFGGNINLKKERSGLLAPHDHGTTPEANALNVRYENVSHVSLGMSLPEVVQFLGNWDDMFEQADRNDYQKILLYSLNDKKTAIIWFDRNDKVTLVYIAATNDKELDRSSTDKIEKL